MLDFKIDKDKCTLCSACVKDCPIKIIHMDKGGLPYIKPEDEEKCMRCQHCLAVCPTAALSIFGVDPDTCTAAEQKATAEQMEALIRNRRSVRQFKKQNVSAEKLAQLIKATANAPTGKNTRTAELHIIDSMDEMKKFSDKVIDMLEELDSQGRLTGGWEFFSSVTKAYRHGTDIIFRGAPHLMIATAPKSGPTPLADAYISLAYAELMASSMGLGTVWLGFMMYLFQLMPGLRDVLNIPDDHELAYVLLLGEPSVKYHRGVKRDEIKVNRITLS